MYVSSTRLFNSLPNQLKKVLVTLNALCLNTFYMNLVKGFHMLHSDDILRSVHTIFSGFNQDPPPPHCMLATEDCVLHRLVVVIAVSDVLGH